MTLVLVNYANFRYKTAQKKNKITGLTFGGFDKVLSYTNRSIDKKFYRENREILTQERGNGYWLWKPYFIKKALDQVDMGDYVFYCDSGAHFINSVKPLIKLCNEFNTDIVSFELVHIEKYWTKRDAFLLMNCDSPKYYDSPQRLACYSLWRKSAFSVKFIDEYVELSKDKRLLTDCENRVGALNYDGFQDHRHDQSIFSLMLKKYNLIPFRDPSQWGNNSKALYPNSPYDQLIAHTRSRDQTFFEALKSGIKRRTEIVCRYLNKSR
jgi:hypothetical protein